VGDVTGARLHVAVVGAGAIGMSVAMHAAELGADVTIVERGYPASGSSSLSLGVFNRQTPDSVELELRVRSIELLDELARTDGLPLERIGYLRLARAPEQLERFAAAVDAQRALGYHGGRVVDAAELPAFVPGLNCDDLVGALYGADDGALDGHLVCAAYQRRAEAAGARLLVRAPVDAVDVRADGIRLRTPAADIRCDRLVNAAGPWAGKVAELMGLRCPVHVQPNRIALGRLRRPLRRPLPTVNEYVPGASQPGLVLRGEGTNRLLAMLHSHAAVPGDDGVDPDDYTPAVGFDYVEEVAARLAHRLPGLADDLSLDAGWGGLYPISPDSRFIVGPYEDDRRIVAAAGVGAVGITVSGAVGRLAAEWAVLGVATTFGFADRLLPDRASLRAEPVS
jgi:sarcosine oxidase subunit beta